MNNRRENTLSMAASVQAVLGENKNAWQTLPAFVTSAAGLDTRIQTIRSLVTASQTSTKGVTLTKKNARTAMTDDAVKIAGAVRAYATTIGDEKLFATVNFSRSDFRKARDSEVGPLCQGVHDTADGVVANLADYGVVPADLDAFQDKITAYDGLVGKPRSARTKTTAANTLLATEFDSMERLLGGRLDGLMEKFRDNQPSFYEAYRAARRTVDNAAGHNGKSGDNGSNGHSDPTPTPPA